MDVIIVTEAKKIPNGLCNRNQACKATQMYPLCITDSDNDSILDEIKSRDTI